MSLDVSPVLSTAPLIAPLAPLCCCLGEFGEQQLPILLVHGNHAPLLVDLLLNARELEGKTLTLHAGPPAWDVDLHLSVLFRQLVKPVVCDVDAEEVQRQQVPPEDEREGFRNHCLDSCPPEAAHRLLSRGTAPEPLSCHDDVTAQALHSVDKFGSVDAERFICQGLVSQRDVLGWDDRVGVDVIAKHLCLPLDDSKLLHRESRSCRSVHVVPCSLQTHTASRLHYRDASGNAALEIEQGINPLLRDRCEEFRRVCDLHVEGRGGHG
mmetsp:Transcript_44259/g.87339  ORF Transcript_44259/g.87339 Transcript_44259/m.87339 type:complete len:267 (-) Transcript_44259:1506-2306(-)